MDNPGERDVTVDETFHDTMAQQLFDDMRQACVENVEEVAACWESDYRHRCIISGFIKDSALGKKRLASMPAASPTQYTQPKDTTSSDPQ